MSGPSVEAQRLSKKKSSSVCSIRRRQLCHERGMTSNAALLTQVPLFASLSVEELSHLAAFLRRRRFAKEETIFHQGDPGTALYIIEEGAVKSSSGPL